MANQKEVAKAASKQKVVTVYDWMKTNKNLLAKSLPRHITPERLLGIFTMVTKSNSELASCTQMSLISAVVQTVQLGLTPGNIGHCHYVPFNNKGVKEAQFIIGYKGIVELLNRCGKATLLSTEVVYDGDLFEYELGLNPVLKHIPAWDGPTGEIKGVYCVAKNLVANEKVFVFMTKEEIDKVKGSSKAAGSEYSPWNKWYSEMAKKTVIKRICKLLPLSVDEQKQLATDETIKREVAPDMTDVTDVATWPGDTIDADPPNSDGPPENNASDSPPEERSPAEPGPTITEKQGKRFYAIAKGAGYSDEGIHEKLMYNWNLESSKDITKDKYEEICNHFEQHPVQA